MRAPESSNAGGRGTVRCLRGVGGDSGRTLLTVFIVAVVGQWHCVHGAGETRHGRGRGPGARGMQLAELASEVRGTETAVRLHAHTSIVTDQRAQDWEGEVRILKVGTTPGRCSCSQHTRDSSVPSIRIRPSNVSFILNLFLLSMLCPRPSSGHLLERGRVVQPSDMAWPARLAHHALRLFIYSPVTYSPGVPRFPLSRLSTISSACPLKFLLAFQPLRFRSLLSARTTV